MIRFEAGTVLNILSQLDQYEKLADSITGCLDHERTRGINEFLFKEVQPLCSLYDLSLTRQQLTLFIADTGRTSAISRVVLKLRIQDMRRILTGELRHRLAVFIPPDRAEFFDLQEQPDSAVARAFPEAVPELRSAGTCIALDLATAGVFHLIRAAEYGLRLSATKGLGITFTFPIEFATWGNVLNAIDDKLKEVKKMQRAEARASCLQFYAGIVQEMRAFQVIWRDPNSHARAMYDTDQAISAYNHVNRLLERVLKMVVSYCGEPPDHEANHANPQHCLAMIEPHFIVGAKPPRFAEPAEGSFDNPAFGQDFETFGVVAPPHDFQMQFAKGPQLLDPLDQSAQVTAIRPDDS